MSVRSLWLAVKARQEREEAEARALQIAEAKKLKSPTAAQLEAIQERNASHLERRSVLQHAKEQQRLLEKKRIARLHAQVHFRQAD